MGLLREEDFQHDPVRELTRYQGLLEAGLSEDEAKNSSTGLGEPWILWCDLPSECFCCSEKLLLPFIYWAGAHNQMIGLHIKCAERFIKSISKDLVRINNQRHEPE